MRSKPIEVCSVHDVPSNRGRVFIILGKAVAVWNIDGRFYATGACCPHADGPLVSGVLRETEITCPMHGWRFDVTTGQGRFPPDARILSHPVSRRGDRLFITLED